jgi:hypothetical protein
VGSGSLFSCSSAPTSTPLSASGQNIAGKGTVTVKNDHNENTVMSIDVKHLAPPERVSAASTTYVVWLSPTDKTTGPQNLGALAVDEHLNGKLKTSTPFSSFELFITAEPSPTVLEPTGEHMFWTKVSNREAA